MKEKILKGKEKFSAWVRRLNEKRELNTDKYKRLNLWLMLLFPVFICCMAEINQGKYVSSFLTFLISRPSVMIFNVIIASLIFVLLLAVFRKGWLAVATQSVIYMALSTTELFKYGTNGNHLILSDMKLFRSVKSLTSFAYIKITPRLIIYFIIVIAFMAAVFYFNPKIKLKPMKRVLASVCCVVPAAGLVMFPSFSTPVYSFFNLDTTAATNTFKLNEKFDSNSMLAFLVETASESYANRITEPENYTEDTLDSILEVNIEGNGDFNGGVKPNVIVVMSEAFADFREFDELDVDDSHYEAFDRASAEGAGGVAISPTYASWTVRSEFELLFGLPVRAINDPNMPQRDLAEREQPALAQYYKDWGYSTAYVHPFMGTFYSRYKVYERFGFDKLIFDEDFTVPVEYFGTYIDDSTVFNQIEQLITETDEPMYIHTTTMQNHQPYNQGEDPTNEFGNYLQWIEHTGDNLEVFLESIAELDEPTLVFMVGDHFPSLRGDLSVYNEIGISSDNCSQLYEQKYFVWSNYGADLSAVPEENVSFFYMPYVLMNIIDAPRDEYIQTMNNYMETLPVYSTEYDCTTERDSELDLLTYDRVIGEALSADIIADELAEQEEESDD